VRLYWGLRGEGVLAGLGLVGSGELCGGDMRRASAAAHAASCA